MKLLGKLKLITLFATMYLIFSCSEKSAKNDKILVLKNTTSTRSCVSLNELSFFYNQIKATCKTSNRRILFFSDELEEHYKKDFCSLINDAIKNIDGEIEYNIDENCQGIINLISVEIIKDSEGNKFRNEYATYLYVRKEKGKLKIYKIDGAG